MHFGLTEEQQLLQETVRGFVAGECPPPRLREIFDGGAGHDPALWKGLAEIGLAGLTVPEAFGGAGLGLLELALVMEELGAGALPGPIFGHALACLAIQLAGSEEQQRRWLPDLASGERIATVAFAESERRLGSRVVAARRSAILRGAKRHVPHAADRGAVRRGACAAADSRGRARRGRTAQRRRARHRSHASDRRALVRRIARGSARRSAGAGARVRDAALIRSPPTRSAPRGTSCA
jgi:alkylation response protein AidB-like acyl-CoA dehydrogenase